MKPARVIAMFLGLLCFSAWSYASGSAACKPMTHYGVRGCEILVDQTCPKGYHRQVVDPPNPIMKAPSVLMCVADKPPARNPTKDNSRSNDHSKTEGAGLSKHGLEGDQNFIRK